MLSQFGLHLVDPNDNVLELGRTNRLGQHIETGCWPTQPTLRTSHNGRGL